MIDRKTSRRNSKTTSPGVDVMEETLGVKGMSGAKFPVTEPIADTVQANGVPKFLSVSQSKGYTPTTRNSNPNGATVANQFEQAMVFGTKPTNPVSKGMYRRTLTEEGKAVFDYNEATDSYNAVKKTDRYRDLANKRNAYLLDETGDFASAGEIEQEMEEITGPAWQRVVDAQTNITRVEEAEAKKRLSTITLSGLVPSERTDKYLEAAERYNRSKAVDDPQAAFDAYREAYNNNDMTDDQIWSLVESDAEEHEDALQAVLQATRSMTTDEWKAYGITKDLEKKLRSGESARTENVEGYTPMEIERAVALQTINKLNEHTSENDAEEGLAVYTTWKSSKGKYDRGGNWTGKTPVPNMVTMDTIERIVSDDESRKDIYRHLSDEEIDVLLRVMATGDTNAVETVVEALTTECQVREMRDQKIGTQEWAADHPGLATMQSVATQAGKSIDFVNQLVGAALGHSQTEIAYSSEATRFASTAVGQVNENIRVKNQGTYTVFGKEHSTEDFLCFIFGTGYSVLESLSRMGLGALGLAMGGMQAGSQRMLECFARGCSTDQAVLLSAFSCAAEIITEKVSLDELFKHRTGGNFAETLWEILKQSFTEGTEEIASDIINDFADWLIMQDESELRKNAEAYAKENGVSVEEATWHLIITGWGESFAGGAISGLAFGIGEESVAVTQKGGYDNINYYRKNFAITPEMQVSFVRDISGSILSQGTKKFAFDYVDSVMADPSILATKSGAATMEQIAGLSSYVAEAGSKYADLEAAVTRRKANHEYTDAMHNATIEAEQLIADANAETAAETQGTGTEASSDAGKMPNSRKRKKGKKGKNGTATAESKTTVTGTTSKNGAKPDNTKVIESIRSLFDVAHEQATKSTELRIKQEEQKQQTAHAKAKQMTLFKNYAAEANACRLAGDVKGQRAAIAKMRECLDSVNSAVGTERTQSKMAELQMQRFQEQIDQIICESIEKSAEEVVALRQAQEVTESQIDDEIMFGGTDQKYTDRYNGVYNNGENGSELSVRGDAGTGPEDSGIAEAGEGSTEAGPIREWGDTERQETAGVVRGYFRRMGVTDAILKPAKDITHKAVEASRKFFDDTGLSVAFYTSKNGPSGANINGHIYVKDGPTAGMTIWHEYAEVRYKQDSDYKAAVDETVSGMSEDMMNRFVETYRARDPEALKAMSDELIAEEFVPDLYGILKDGKYEPEVLFATSEELGKMTPEQRQAFEAQVEETIAPFRDVIEIDANTSTADAESSPELEAMNTVAESEPKVYEPGETVDPANTGFSYASLANGLGYETRGTDRKMYRKDGTEVTEITADDVRKTPVGALINYAFERGDIDAMEAGRQYEMFAEIGNVMLKTNDFSMAQQFIGAIAFTAMKLNSDKQYGTTYDFVSICTKTQAMIDKMSARMVAKGRALTEKEILAAYQMTFDEGLPVNCPECYVFTRWMGVGSLLDNLSNYQKKFCSMKPSEVIEVYNDTLAEVMKYADENGITRGKAKGAVAKKILTEIQTAKENYEKAVDRGDSQKELDKLESKVKKLESMEDTCKALVWIENVYFGGDGNMNAKNPKMNSRASVPTEILFDLNRSGEFAESYPEAWGFRTTQGAGYGKAITPYADARVGESIHITNNTGFIKSVAAGNGNNLFSDAKGVLSAKAKEVAAKARSKMKIQSWLGGQRWQSTSDARYENATDYLLAAVDLQAMGGFAQSYTKVSEAVELFARLGLFPNQSLMPKGDGFEDDGVTLADSKVGGMDPEKAFANREKFGTTETGIAGTITIGVNDKHIRALMNSYVRDFIIPYHASGGKVDVISSMRNVQDKDAKSTDKKSYDYTRVQGEKILSDEALRYKYIYEQGMTEEDAQEKIAQAKKTREMRLWILMKGKVPSKQAKSAKNHPELIDESSAEFNPILRRLYDRINSEEWSDMGPLPTGKVAGQIFPNEYWDQTVDYEHSGQITKDYLDYCESLGFLPKFSGVVVRGSKEFTDDKGNKFTTSLAPVFYSYKDENGKTVRVPFQNLAYKYDEAGNITDEYEDFFWKVLVDRRMYDNNGQYIPQGKVNLGRITTDTVTNFAKVEKGSRQYQPGLSRLRANAYANADDAEIADAYGRATTKKSGDIMSQTLNGSYVGNGKQSTNIQDEMVNGAGFSTVAPINERVSGDKLLDAQDLIEEVKANGGEVDENGYVTLYHRTSKENADRILSSGVMSGKEDGLFFSTKENGDYNSDYGDSVIKLHIPAEKLVIDDEFGDEAHLRIPLGKSRSMDVSGWIDAGKNVQEEIVDNASPKDTLGSSAPEQRKTVADSTSLGERGFSTRAQVTGDTSEDLMSETLNPDFGYTPHGTVKPAGTKEQQAASTAAKQASMKTYEADLAAQMDDMAKEAARSRGALDRERSKRERAEARYANEKAELKGDIADLLQGMKDQKKQARADQRFAVEFQKELDKEKYGDKIGKIKDEAAARLKAQKEADRAKFVDTVRDMKIEKVRALQEQRAKQKASEVRQKTIDSIRTSTKALAEWMAKPNGKEGKSVPKFLHETVNGLLQNIDIGTAQTAYKNGKERLPSQAAQGWRDSIKALEDFANHYKADPETDYVNGFEEEFPQWFRDTVHELNTTLEERGVGHVLDMSQEELDATKAIVGFVTSTVKTANQLHENAKFSKISDIGEATIEESMRRKKKRTSDNGLVRAMDNLINSDMLSSFNFFRRLGSAGKSISKELSKGFEKYFGNIRTVQGETNKALESTGTTTKQINEWNDFKKSGHTFTLESGEEIGLTTGQIMEIYALTRRSAAYSHLFGEGIRVADMDGNQAYRNHSYKLTEADVDSMIETLTPQQKMLADSLQTILSTTCADLGNEVTEKQYMVDMYGEDFYWPMSVDGNALKTAEPKQSTAFNALINSGFTHRITKSGKALTIGNAFDTYSDHVAQMSAYNGVALPVGDLLKWTNYRSKDEEGNEISNRNVKTAITDIVGESGQRYIVNLIKDIEGLSSGSTGLEIKNVLVRNLKSAAVSAKLRVVIQQPTAIIRAMSMINPVYFVKQGNLAKNIKEMQEKSDLAFWKDQGNFDIGTGRSIYGMLFGDRNVKEKVVNALNEPAGMADNFGWGQIWGAVKAEVAKQHPNVEVGSDEFFALVNDRFSDVINNTQVIDTILHRSQIMRSKDSGVKEATAFMNEPIKTFGMIADAVYDVKNGEPGSVKRLATTTVAIAASTALNSIVTAINDALKKREPEEPLDEMIIENFKSSYIDSINPLDQVPFLSSIMSVLQGYSPDKMDMGAVDDFVKAVKRAYKYIDEGGSKSYTAYGVASAVLKAAGDLTGLPVSGILNSAETIVNAIVPGAISSKKLDANSMKRIALVQEAGVSKKAAKHYMESASTFGSGNNANADKALSILTFDDDGDGKPDWNEENYSIIASVLGLSYNPDKNGTFADWAEGQTITYLKKKSKGGQYEVSEEEFDRLYNIYDDYFELLGLDSDALPTYDSKTK